MYAVYLNLLYNTYLKKAIPFIQFVFTAPFLQKKRPLLAILFTYNDIHLPFSPYFVPVSPAFAACFFAFDRTRNPPKRKKRIIGMSH
jgi:hypothetical protein